MYCLHHVAGNAINDRSQESLTVTKGSLMTIDDSNLNKMMCNLVLNHASLMIFQWNYLSWMIHYDTQVAYWGTALWKDLIFVSHQMSCMIDPCWLCKLSAQQLQKLWQDARIQELWWCQHNFYEQIHHQFNFIYWAKDQPIHNKYKEIKQSINCILKERKCAFKSQLQVNYDAAASMQDMMAQIAVNEAVLSLIQPCLALIRYAFEEHAQIAQALFDPLQSAKPGRNLKWQIIIVNDLILLCTCQEHHSWKPY